MEVFFAFLTIRFLKGATVFNLFVITDLRDPKTWDWIAKSSDLNLFLRESFQEFS